MCCCICCMLSYIAGHAADTACRFSRDFRLKDSASFIRYLWYPLVISEVFHGIALVADAVHSSFNGGEPVRGF